VLGEGEYTMAALCRKLRDGDKEVGGINGLGYKKDGKQVFTPPAPLIANLDELPFPARHQLASRWYFAPPRIRGVWTEALITVMASRGCPYKCVWCSSCTMFGRSVRTRTPGSVFAEIAQARKEFSIDSVWFADDTFTLNHAWVEELCGMIVKAGWKDFKWACQARVNTVTPRLLQLMKAAGCAQVDFGVESGSPRVLEVIQKDITLDQIKRAFRDTKAVGLNCFASIMIGTPGETREDIELTAKLLEEIRPDYTEIYYATPYPGTRLYDIAKEAGLLKEPFSYDNWYVSRNVDKPFICMSFTEAELMGFRRMLQDRVRGGNFKTLFRNPGFILGGFRILFSGFPGLFTGLKRFFKTRDLDNVFYEILREYRRKTKNEKQRS
jgi:anaerobic magnesium-protoporphyrin IX monomethyl ester cyclase